LEGLRLNYPPQKPAAREKKRFSALRVSPQQGKKGEVGEPRTKIGKEGYTIPTQAAKFYLKKCGCNCV